jgi:hypothetical protein
MTYIEMPRVFELKALINDQSNTCFYFKNFENSICDEPSKKQVWLAREQEFQQLDQESWFFLMDEARPHLVNWNEGRGLEQLISILNQARAHNYLVKEGCLQVRFIPRSKVNGQKTPDLGANLNGRKILCEVKTINISDVEATRRQNNAGISINNYLGEKFFEKLIKTLESAKKQLASYDVLADARYIVFVVINFDDFLAEYKVEYFKQIDHELSKNSILGLEIVLYNQKTAFHSKIKMLHANVINE